VSKATVAKKAAMKEYEECKPLKTADPDRYNMATVKLLSLPEADTVAFEAATIECDCCNCVLARQKDFLEQQSGIEEAYTKYNKEHGTHHRCLFLPKFHPELNYIERIWGRMKYYIRLHCDNSFATMCLNITAAMGPVNLPLAMIRRFARTSIAYLYAYRSGKDIISASTWIKQHRVHRKHSNQMDAALEDAEHFDTDMEKLFYPLGRPNEDQILIVDPDDGNDMDHEFDEIPEVTSAPATNADDYDDNLDDLFDAEDGIDDEMEVEP
jgi:hypothetical protein